MSAVNISCYTIPPEKESGDGEINCYKSLSCDGSDPSHTIVSEIMNDILDNAFEIIVANSIQQRPKFEKITPNVVGDLLENILSPSSHNDTSSQTYCHDETVLLDDEIKRIIKEMKFPPEQKNIICTQGVGDQLGDKSELKPDKIFAEPVKRNTLERKNRLTNLVRNSKQMLAKLVCDNENELKISKSEEVQEKILRVIDLETEINLESGQSTIEERTSTNFAEPGLIVQLPSDSTMDMINLLSNIPQNLSNRTEDEEVEEKEIASCSFAKAENTKNYTTSKKKWNLGVKILKLFKRHSRNK